MADVKGLLPRAPPAGGTSGGNQSAAAAAVAAAAPPPPPAAPAAAGGGGVAVVGKKPFQAFKKRKMNTESVVTTYGAATVIKAGIQPATPQSTVTMNARVAVGIAAIRRIGAARSRQMGGDLRYPDVTGDGWNILMREPVFRSGRRSRDGRTTTSALVGSMQVWSAFNLLEDDEEPILVGFATDTVVIDPTNPHQSANMMVPVALQGTMSLDVCEPTAPGDLLYWDLPPRRQETNGMIRPVTQKDGVEVGKFTAVLRPLSFSTHGSADLYRNYMSFLMGSFKPTPGTNAIWDRLVSVINFVSKTRTDATTDMDELSKVLASSGRTADELNRERQALYNGSDATELNESVTRLAASQILRCSQEHSHFFTSRVCALALDAGANQAITCMVRAGHSW